jgi:hypothetical protein
MGSQQAPGRERGVLRLAAPRRATDPLAIVEEGRDLGAGMALRQQRPELAGLGARDLEPRRVIRRVDFRDGNLVAGGNAKVELWGR